MKNMNWGNLRFIPLFLLLGVVTLVQYVAAGTVRADAPGENPFSGNSNGSNFADSWSDSCGNSSPNFGNMDMGDGETDATGSSQESGGSGNEGDSNSGQGGGEGCGGCGSGDND
ncbi:MAG: hypothetical protein HYS74_00265 [Parcubacteria group bacterium]|nr:hypothetical protein [Parcubacteria group bacterium]